MKFQITKPLLSTIALLSLAFSAQADSKIFTTAEYEGRAVEESTLSCQLEVASSLESKRLSYSFLLSKHISRPETFHIDLKDLSLRHLRSQLDSRIVAFEDLRLKSTPDTLQFENSADKPEVYQGALENFFFSSEAPETGLLIRLSGRSGPMLGAMDPIYNMSVMVTAKDNYGQSSFLKGKGFNAPLPFIKSEGESVSERGDYFITPFSETFRIELEEVTMTGEFVCVE